MTVHDPNWTLPMTLDLISEVHWIKTMPLLGTEIRSELFSTDSHGDDHSLWKGVLTSMQLVSIYSWMNFMRLLEEGKED